jgi:hypothetical protein
MGNLGDALFSPAAPTGAQSPSSTQSISQATAGSASAAPSATLDDANKALRIGALLVVGAVLLLVFGSRILNDVRIG